MQERQAQLTGGVDVLAVLLLIFVAIALFVAVLAVAVRQKEVSVMVAGGVASFSGLLLLGPVVVPLLLRAVAPLVGRPLGAAGRLAGSNALRNPRRTAATTASLLVGVTLATAVLTGTAGSRVSVAEEMDSEYPVDATVVATEGALPDDLAEVVAALPGVRSAVALQGARAEMSGVGTVTLVAAEGRRGARARRAAGGEAGGRRGLRGQRSRR